MKNKDSYLLKISNRIVLIQVYLHILFFIGIFIGDIFVIFFIPILLLSCLYFIKALFFDDNLCPNCNEYFFKKKGEMFNIGFSIYTKKCTNCGYKLKKDLSFADDLLEYDDDKTNADKS